MKRFTAFASLTLFPIIAMAVQSVTFTITKPTGYEDGTAFGTELVAYMVYDAKTNVRLFSTYKLSELKNDIPDTSTCFYVKAGIMNTTDNIVIASTVSDASPTGCMVVAPPVFPTKKLAKPGLAIK